MLDPHAWQQYGVHIIVAITGTLVSAIAAWGVRRLGKIMRQLTHIERNNLEFTAGILKQQQEFIANVLNQLQETRLKAHLAFGVASKLAPELSTIYQQAIELELSTQHAQAAAMGKAV